MRNTATENRGLSKLPLHHTIFLILLKIELIVICFTSSASIIFIIFSAISPAATAFAINSLFNLLIGGRL
ncbi:MAG: hypothetical protein RLZZ419_1633 [Pseudomonadota bacterium]